MEEKELLATSFKKKLQRTKSSNKKNCKIIDGVTQGDEVEISKLNSVMWIAKQNGFFPQIM